MNVYKINDIISCEFLKIPKAMFANKSYRSLSSDAKLTYALLYDRLSLSKLNGWINENEEVYLIYTREEITEDLGITYKKAISAFKELISANLIKEQRCGRGIPNKIYIVKFELSGKQAKTYVKHENLRTANSAYQGNTVESEICQNSTSKAENEKQDMPNGNIKNFQNGTSKTSDLAVLDMPDQHTNYTYNNETYNNHTENSQSVSRDSFHFYLPSKDEDRQTDGIYKLDEILERCDLGSFDSEEQKILYDAIERLFYSKTFRIGNAELPQEKVRSRLYELDGSILRSALANLHKNDRQIKNLTGFLMSTIFNCITEEYSLLHVDPYLNSLRACRRE